MSYYVGLDMGTSSIGWAITNPDYELLRLKGCDSWGVREFEPAEPAVSRRTNRVARRRLKRERIRKGHIRNFFSEEIEKVDPLFFIRLDNSKYYGGDKDTRLNSKNCIFDDADYTDKDYYAQYPSIYHLRRELINNSNAPYDVRLVYLAVINLFKHRGHFLLSGSNSIQTESEIQTIYQNLCDSLLENYNITFDVSACNRLIDIIKSKSSSRRDKALAISAEFGLIKGSDEYKRTIPFVNCLAGLEVSASDLFDVEIEDKVNICFKSFSYMDNIPVIQEAVGEDNYSVIEMMKTIYDYAVLSETLRGYEFLSFARCDEYDKHNADLKLLKATYRRLLSAEAYDRLFRSNAAGSYSAYVNSSCASVKGRVIKIRRGFDDRSAEKLFLNIKKDLNDFKSDPDVISILNDIEKENYLPKQLTGANGVIPNQVHAAELKRILDNASGYLPFLNVVDETGLSVSDKIMMLFKFNIPYYVGPLGVNSKTGWLVRNEEGEILPWNFSTKINMEETKEAFINNLIRSCTYISGEKVLPKASLLYEKYSVLNEINNIKIDKESISVELKQDIYTDLFEKSNSVTRDKLVRYLIGRGVIDRAEQLSGIDVQINNKLSSYNKMHKIFGDKLKLDEYIKYAEEIIYWGTIFTDSKNEYKAKLDEFVNKGIITKKEANIISGYKFKDWGRLSRAILEMPGTDFSSGEITNVISAMWNTNMNFMSLLYSEQFSFIEELKGKKVKLDKSLCDFTYEDLQDSYYSPAVKRMIWQTISLLKEIEEIMGCAPNKIFIEVVRRDDVKGDKGRKSSREKDLLEKYKNIKKTELHDWSAEIKAAGANGTINSKKMFLYLLQMGKDMYTGKEISMDDLFDNNKYNIDHIYPRCSVKDDSLLNNLVLVNTADNQNVKKDLYPIPLEIAERKGVKELWDTLHTLNLLSDEKYHRLIDRKSFSDEQKIGFINRQLVETSQGNLGVATLLTDLLPDTTIVYSKGENVSEFRKTYKFYKSRIANEFHHAKDAYLNIVVGNVYHTKFTNNPANYIATGEHYNLNKMYEKNIQRNGVVAWVAGEKGTMATVKKVMVKNSPIVTKMTVEKHTEFYNITLLSKKKAKADNYVPIKEGMDVVKYGGYTSLKPAYFFFVEHGPIGKRKKTFDVMPCLYADSIKNIDDLTTYCSKYLVNPRVICEKIKKYSLIRIDGYYYYLVGLDTRKNVELHNAVNMHFDSSKEKYIHKIEKTDSGLLDVDITRDGNIELYDYLLEKTSHKPYSNSLVDLKTILSNGRDKFVSLTIDDQLKTLMKILNITSVGTGNVNLKEINGPSEAGRIRKSGDMTKRNELLLITQSMTGLLYNVKDLLSI